ncbi:MAG TPA: hypothetical protein VGG39_19315 [Polyangiaceae bacterium]|jgi:hypothetical protein
MTITINRIICVLKLSLNVPAFIKQGNAIVTAMTNNPHFSGAAAQVAAAGAALVKLDAAETATQTRAKGTVQARNAARTEAVTALHGLKALVQAQADASPDDAETIIVSAGMQAKKPAVRVKAGFEAKPAATSGSATLTVRAAGQRASYEWEWSSDGAKTWTATAPSLQAHTTITGLPVASSIQFRYRPITKAGPGDWSQVITYVVK